MPLRKCKQCGLEANTPKELELFVRRSNRPFGRGYICKACGASNLRKGGKHYEKTVERRQRRASFKGKQKPSLVMRMNICSICGKTYPNELKRQTSFHHTVYDESHPEGHTIEVCNSCHLKAHWADEVFQKKMGNARKKAWANPEYQLKISKARSTTWKDPVYREEHRKAISEGRKKYFERLKKL